MASTCPACGSGVNLKLGDDGKTPMYVYCKERKIKKLSKEEMKKQKTNNQYFNEGTCNFHVYFNQQNMKKYFSKEEMKTLLDGGVITNLKGDEIRIKDNLQKMDDYSTTIIFKEDEEF